MEGEPPLAKLIPKDKLNDVCEVTYLDGVDILREQLQKRKENNVFLTQREIEDLCEAGYEVDAAFDGKRVQIVEPVDSGEDKEELVGVDELGSMDERVGDELNPEDPDTQSYESKEDSEELNDHDDVPDWARYKPIHEDDDEFCVEEDVRLSSKAATMETGAHEQENDAQYTKTDSERVGKQLVVHELHEKNDEEDNINEELDVSGDDVICKEDWTRPMLQSDDSDAEDVSIRRNVKVWEDFVDVHHVEIGLYSRFKSAKIFRGVLKNYAADKGFDYIFTKNEPKQIGVVCKEDQCKFYIWCTAMQNSTDLEIKTFNPEHACEKAVNNSKISYDWLGMRYKKEIKNNPNMDTTSFAKIVYEDIQVNVSDYKLYRAMKWAKALIVGDTSVQYSRLYDYLHMMTKTNPNSKWKVEVEHHANVGEQQTTPRFIRLYMRFGPEKKGFNDACRPFIGIDGCHLKGYYGGQLLSAVAWDANDGMYPLAFGIVEQETKQSWKWFLHELFTDFGYTEQPPWVIISDKQKGLVELFKDWLPNVEHRYCMRHMYENWYKDFKSVELKKMLWACAKATSESNFEKKMEELKALNIEAYEWLRKRPAKEWCKCFFSSRASSNIQTNSLSECFNSWISKGRDLPIISLCEFLRRKMMNRFYVKKQQAVKWDGLLCPDIYLMLEYNKKDSRTCFAHPSGNGYYEVDDGSNTYSVCLGEKKCTCLEWQLNGIPCKHAVSAIVKKKHRPELYVSQYYHVETFKRQYAGQIFPIPGKSDWEETTQIRVHPPIVQKPPGRPRVRRKRNPAETNQKTTNLFKASKKGAQMTCSRCEQKGHNARSCTPKDYGETTSQRKKRMKENIHVEGSNTPIMKDVEAPNANADKPGPVNKGFKVDVQGKRDRAKKKMAKKRQAYKEAKFKLQENADGAPAQCTPEQIELKRQAALERQRDKQVQQSSQPCDNWRTGVYPTKRGKLQVIRKELKKSGQTNQKVIKQTVPVIPAEGLAHEHLKAQTNKEKQFTKLKKGGHTSDAGGSSSRFAMEAMFTRSASKLQMDVNEGPNTQPPPRASVIKPRTWAYSSQP